MSDIDIIYFSFWECIEIIIDIDKTLTSTSRTLYHIPHISLGLSERSNRVTSDWRLL